MVEWTVRWGGRLEHLEEVAEARAEQGLSTPSWDDRPTLHEGLAPVWNAWTQLSSQRRTGDGYSPHPLAYSDLAAFFALHGYDDPLLLRDWTRWLLVMDRAWIGAVIEQNEAARPPAPPPPRPPR